MKKSVRKTAVGKRARGQSLSVEIKPDVLATVQRASKLTGATVAWLVNEGARVCAGSIATDQAVEADYARMWRQQSVPLPTIRSHSIAARIHRLAKTEGVSVDEVVDRALRAIVLKKGFTR